MRIKPCPQCGRAPKIQECMQTKNGTRRRLVKCPNFCDIFKSEKRILKDWYFIFYGDGDDNEIYKVWNEKIN